MSGPIFTINNTDGTLSFSLLPSAINGPGGVFRNSDLTLSGFSRLLYGEGQNNNFYRLLETSACPAKELNDYNPSTLLFDYDPNTDPLLPKDEQDLGFGNGITTPINGQLWFNTTTKTLYVYDGDGLVWQLTTQDLYLLLDGTSTMTGNIDVGSNYIVNLLDPVNPQDGATKQYVDTEVLNLVGEYVNETGDTMTGFLTLNADPTAALHAATKQYVDANFVNVTGDTMTGVLVMNADLNMGSNQITNVGDPVGGTDGMSRNYADLRYVNVAGDTMTGDLNMSGSKINNVGDPNLSTDAMSRGYADNRYVLESGDTMTGFLTLNAAPTAALHAATKQYVDSVAGGGASGFSSGQTWQNVTGSRTENVTYTNSTSNPIQVMISVVIGNIVSYDFEFYINGALAAKASDSDPIADIISVIIQPGDTYQLSIVPSGSITINLTWFELR